jgi:hypothetical protein
MSFRARSRRRPMLLLPVLVSGGIAMAQGDAPPDASEQERILKLVREYAAGYRLPDVTYDRSARVVRQQKGTGEWREVWSSEARLVEHDDHTYMCCRLGKNRKPIPNQWIATWYVPGSGTYPWDRTTASVTWNRWEEVRGHRTAVFDFDVSQQDSRMLLPNFRDKSVIPRVDGHSFEGPVTNLRNAVVLPYRGQIWVDPASGAIWRTSMIFDGLRARKLYPWSTTTDYDLVTLGTAQYLVQTKTVHDSSSSDDPERTEHLCRNYRKFEANSSITFFGADSTITYRP